VSEEIIINLTENLANEGLVVPFKGEYELPSQLPYPNAKLQKVVVDLNVEFTNPNVEIEGVLNCFIDGLCDRCLEKTSKCFAVPFKQTFYRDSAPQDCYVYENSMLNATKAINDEIILSVPSLFLCKDDCKGLCPQCGANLNNGKCDCCDSKENAFSILKNLKF